MQQPARKNLAEILNPNGKRVTLASNSGKSSSSFQSALLPKKIASEQSLLKSGKSESSLSPKAKLIRMSNNRNQTELPPLKDVSDSGERVLTLHSETNEQGQLANALLDVRTSKNSSHRRSFPRANTINRLKPIKDESLRPFVNPTKEFLTPKLESRNLYPSQKYSDKSSIMSLPSNEEGILPKIGIQENKDRQSEAPKNNESITDVSNRYSFNTPESKSSSSLSKDIKIRLSEPSQRLSTVRDETPKKTTNSSFQLSPKARQGRSRINRPIKEEKAELPLETTQSDNKDDKNSQYLKKPSKKNGLNFRHLIFSPDVEKAIFKKHLLLVHSGLIYSTQFLKGPSEKFLETKQINLGDPEVGSDPNPIKRKTLVLDLDETLIKSCPGATDYDKLAFAKKDDQTFEIPFKIRPYAQYFISRLKAYYEIIVFTASMKHYAEAIIELLDPEANITYILDRTYCLETKNGYAIKDLRIIKNRDLKNILIVDNLVHSFGLQLENGIPILEWNGEKEDTELKHLVDYLIEASYADDLREYNKKNLRLKELANSSLPHIMLNI